jgi:hypothetical protein
MPTIMMAMGRQRQGRAGGQQQQTMIMTTNNDE